MLGLPALGPRPAGTAVESAGELTLKPVLVSHSDGGGGAARACYRIHRALLRANIGSRLLVRRKLSDDWTVQSAANGFGEVLNRVRESAGARIGRLQRASDSTFHSHNLLPSAWARSLNAGDADVVNLHWVGADTLSIADIGRIRKPVVVTLHDMWAFCGGEHYAPDDASARWREGYHSRNRRAGGGLDLDHWTWSRKRRHWRPMNLVCPSRWLAECAHVSALMRGWPARVVPYPLDASMFRPMEKREARHALNLDERGKVVLFGAIGGSRDARKGCDLLLAALDRLAPNVAGLTAAIVGESEPRRPPSSSVPLRWLGHVNDDAALALIYAAADVMAVPSRQEGLGQSATEAQACGVPVVAFNTGGLRDVVEHGVTGYLAEALSVESLAHGIGWVLADEERRASLGAAARARAVRLWAPDVIAAEYITVYQDAIARASEGDADIA
jgi:glycosyltransferase involved in cell wall biosynthesis